jgi:hypothetical protein
MSPLLSVVVPVPPPPVLAGAFQNPLQPVRQNAATARHAQKRDLMAAPSKSDLPYAVIRLTRPDDSVPFQLWTEVSLSCRLSGRTLETDDSLRDSCSGRSRFDFPFQLGFGLKRLAHDLWSRVMRDRVGCEGCWPEFMLRPKCCNFSTNKQTMRSN